MVGQKAADMAKIPDSANTIEIFDRALLRQNRNRAAPHFKDHDFLFAWCEKQLLDNLSIITRPFSSVLILGGRCSGAFLTSVQERLKPDHLMVMDLSEKTLPRPAAGIIPIQGDEEFLPFAPHSFDLVLSNLSLQCVNDVPGCLLQIRSALKPDGLFMASLFGGQTLTELRQSMMQAELNIKGGVSPRVFPFADKQDMGALMQRAGYALPVIDSDILTVTYSDPFALFKDIRGMGEGNIIRQRQKTFSPRALFMEAAALYHQTCAESDGRIPASFEIIFVHGWAPHASQQKPLKPGSAQTRLADFLGEREEKL